MKFSIHYYIIENHKNDPEGEALAAKYDVDYNGWWGDGMEKFTFTDKVTGSTFTARDEEELKVKLDKMREAFGVKDYA